MASIRIRYWAAARSAAGVAEHSVVAPDCGAALDQALAMAPPELAEVVSACTFLVNGIRHSRESLVTQPAPAVLEVLPPFAGG